MISPGIEPGTSCEPTDDVLSMLSNQLIYETDQFLLMSVARNDPYNLEVVNSYPEDQVTLIWCI